MVKINTCIFISGKGTNLRNLIKKSREYNFPINIKLVISNTKYAKGISFAKINSIPFVVIDTKENNFEIKMLKILEKYKIKLICLAGYMRVLSKRFLNLYGKKIINIHPSLLPKFKGLNTFSRVIMEKEKKTGCTVHYVDEKLDNGNIILRKSFFISKKDTQKSIKTKTQKLEYVAFPEAIISIFRYC